MEARDPARALDHAWTVRQSADERPAPRTASGPIAVSLQGELSLSREQRFVEHDIALPHDHEPLDDCGRTEVPCTDCAIDSHFHQFGDTVLTAEPQRDGQR